MKLVCQHPQRLAPGSTKAPCRDCPALARQRAHPRQAAKQAAKPADVKRGVTGLIVLAALLLSLGAGYWLSAHYRPAASLRPCYAFAGLSGTEPGTAAQHDALEPSGYVLRAAGQLLKCVNGTWHNG